MLKIHRQQPEVTNAGERLHLGVVAERRLTRKQVEDYGERHEEGDKVEVPRDAELLEAGHHDERHQRNNHHYRENGNEFDRMDGGARRHVCYFLLPHVSRRVANKGIALIFLHKERPEICLLQLEVARIDRHERVHDRIAAVRVRPHLETSVDRTRIADRPRAIEIVLERVEA